MSEKNNAYGICLYKINNNITEILLCKSVLSNNKWGFLKGVQEKNESNKKTAVREFYEESGILVKESDLEKFYVQENIDKNIGIYLLNIKKISNINEYFIGDHLKNKYICKENSQVRFFELTYTPEIKKKQIQIMAKIIKELTR